MTDRILIAGAGIGGLSTALALAAKGIRSHIIDRAPAILEIGAGLQIGPNAFRAFAQFGVAVAMDEISFAPKAISLLDSVTGVELSRQTLGAPFEARFGHPYRVAFRADVQQVLLRAVQIRADLISLQLGDGLESFFQDTKSVTVMLDSGMRLEGAALVGADGIWSRVRSKILKAESPRNSGHVAYRAVLPVSQVPPELLTDNVQIWVGPGHHLVCYKLRRGELFNIVAMFESPRVTEGWNALGDAQELQRGFSGANHAVMQLLEQIHEWRTWVLCDRDPAPGWSEGRVTLLGDAAHPMLPYLAQGACMAIEDAARLANEIADSRDDIAGALQRYEAARYARATSVQLAARRTGELNHARGAARDARNRALARRKADDYDAVSWLFGSDGPQPEHLGRTDFSIFGSAR